MTITPHKKRIPRALSILVGALIVTAATLYAVHNATAQSSQSQQAAKTSTDGKETAKDKAEKTPIPVRSVAVEQGQISSYISATANLVADNEVRVIAEWEGRLEKLGVDEGDRVAAGQVLARLAQTDGEIALSKAKVRAENARFKHDRAQKLSEQKLLSPEEFEKVSLEYQIAQQELAEAEWNLEKTAIRAPFAGIVTQRLAQPGQHIRPGDELFVVTDFDPLIARIYLPEKDVLALEEGRKVRVALKADEAIAVDGRIRQISPVVDTATGTVKVTVEAINPPAQVRPGAFVRIDVVRETRPRALLLPKEAIVRELQKTYVFVAADGTARKRSITLGLEEGAHIEATAGLAAGEQVIVAGQGGLKDGAAIELLGTVETHEVDRIADAR
ncbi:MAG: efflux RND transporter periplasmic adaptor subunit [Thermoanaerobaculia bacterium]|nr:efflux RND transporter periplasmic adaptor subunit [Thermoanaerobaculia bacterium]